MKFKEAYTKFKPEKYKQHVLSKNLPHVELAKEIYRKRMKRLTSKVSAGTGVAASFVTGGHSLVASAISGRNVSIESQKIAVLEAEWARRGHPPLPQSTLKDKILPITVAMGGSLFTVGLDVALAGASPDQFYQFTPDPQLNEFLIGTVYYGGIKKGVSYLGNKGVKQVVARAPQSAYDADRQGSSYYSGGKDKYASDEEEDEDEDEDEDDYDYSNEEYSEEEEEEEDEDEDEDEDYSSNKRGGRRYV